MLFQLQRTVLNTQSVSKYKFILDWSIEHYYSIVCKYRLLLWNWVCSYTYILLIITKFTFFVSMLQTPKYLLFEKNNNKVTPEWILKHAFKFSRSSWQLIKNSVLHLYLREKASFKGMHTYLKEILPKEVLIL